jgi:Uma2 family endonuclease
MAPATSSKLTYDDYVKLPDDGKRYEIIDGELYVNPAPVPRHQFIIAVINAAFVNYAREHGGRAAGAPIDVVLADDRIVQPDVIFIKTDRFANIGPKNIQGPPHIVVEVLSDGTRRHDEIQKRKLYESSGVDEYWVVDPEIEMVKLYRAKDRVYTKAAEINTEDGGNITSPLLPGFSLPIAEVFA